MEYHAKIEPYGNIFWVPTPDKEKTSWMLESSISARIVLSR
jgi:hypothetical protein